MRSLWPIANKVDISKAEMRIGFPSGGFIQFFTDENPTAGRGDKFALAVEDEAAQIKEETHFDVILPTLADYEGQSLCLTTPKGRNWVWREHLRGLDPTCESVAFFHAPTSANPMPQIQRAFEAARERLGATSRSFRQEWLAEFIDDAGSVFGNVRHVATGAMETAPNHSSHYVAGIDWGRSIDYTVVAIYDVTLNRVVAYDRFHGFEDHTMAQRVLGFLRRWRVDGTVVEVNVAKWVADFLRRNDLRVVDFTTTNASKSAIMDLVSEKISSGTVTLPNDPTLIGEFEAYDYERLPSGNFRMGAPDGMHDDIVIAVSLAIWGGDKANIVTPEAYASLVRRIS